MRKYLLTWDKRFPAICSRLSVFSIRAVIEGRFDLSRVFCIDLLLSFLSISHKLHPHYSLSNLFLAHRELIFSPLTWILNQLFQILLTITLLITILIILLIPQ